jgi:hypothetical protein
VFVINGSQVPTQKSESKELYRSGSGFDERRVVGSNFFPSGNYRVAFMESSGGTEAESFLVELKSLRVRRIANWNSDRRLRLSNTRNISSGWIGQREVTYGNE